jgi:hypothetical protein
MPAAAKADRARTLENRDRSLPRIPVAELAARTVRDFGDGLPDLTARQITGPA